jgi:tetratricopeptide (TPR) repeat protein
VSSPANPIDPTDPETGRSRLEVLFLDAVDLTPEGQQAFLQDHCGGDPKMAAELQSLLEAEPKSRVTQRFGPYRVTGRIGEGGMGVVYRAVRDDSEYQKDVAIKLIKRGMDSDLIVARFRNERQILANLDHPHIARLLDGNTDEEGSPYLVMEYVAGESLTAYLENRRPGLTGRLELFRKICGAVHYAHQRMVIHRDLKPGNILVTAEGTPKLLDFGIAKLLEAEGGPRTATVQAAQMLTPAYASPEQIRGETATTASDIYSLGVILYQILTGRSPYKASSPSEMLREVCEQEPARPSLNGSRELKGDLDKIVLMALRKDPARRYASVDEFSDDIRRFAQGLPVRAQGESFAYVAKKFARRNRAWVIAAALVLTMAVSSVVSIVRSAAVARVQRAKAEARFNDLRDFAHSVIFDIDTALDGIPAAMPVRVLINKKAEAYLDSLAAETPTDLALRRELATSYNQLARVEGVPGHDNLGNADAARVSLNKALRIIQGSLAIDPQSALDHGLLILIYNSIGQLEWGTGDPAAAMAAHRKGLEEAESLMARMKKPPARLLAAAASAYFFVALDEGANFANLGDPVGTIPLFEKSLDLFQKIDSMNEPTSEAYLTEYRNLANVERVYSAVLYQLGRPVEGEAHYRRAIEYLHSPRAAKDPGTRAVLFATQVWHAYALIEHGEANAAVPLSRSAVELATQLQGADPKNLLGALYLHHAEFIEGHAEGGSGDNAGLDRMERALRDEEAMEARYPEFAYIGGFLTGESVTAGKLALSGGRDEEAKRHFERAAQIAGAQTAAHPADAQGLCNLAEAELGLARYFASRGDSVSAAAHASKGRAAASAVLKIHPDNPWARRLLE